MLVQSVSSVNNSQPLRQVSAVPLRSTTTPSSTPLRNFQSFSADNSYTQTQQLQQKYDLACQLAAYYKTKYEELSKKGNCTV